MIWNSKQKKQVRYYIWTSLSETDKQQMWLLKSWCSLTSCAQWTTRPQTEIWTKWITALWNAPGLDWTSPAQIDTSAARRDEFVEECRRRPKAKVCIPEQDAKQLWHIYYSRWCTGSCLARGARSPSKVLGVNCPRPLNKNYIMCCHTPRKQVKLLHGHCLENNKKSSVILKLTGSGQLEANRSNWDWISQSSSLLSVIVGSECKELSSVWL